jgi:hypothetical protein
MQQKRVYTGRGVILGLSAFLLMPSAGAAPLLSGFGGARDYGELAMVRNDDGSSSLLDLPFAINLFGSTYSQFWINNNGNVTFESRLSTYTPDPFPVSDQPMIAPYWADVDTSAGAADGSNNVWVASPNDTTVVVTWDKVGYYTSDPGDDFFPWEPFSHGSLETDPRNDFQLVLRNRAADTGRPGDFDIEFRYNVLEWTTGDASGGTAGLGGIEAQAGYDAGNGVDFQTLPGSFGPNVLDLQNTTNVAGGEPGLWSFSIRGGAAPGDTPDNPHMPVETEEGWSFEFNVQLDELVFIDPEYAVGYDYIVNAGPNIASVILPDVGDGLYDVFLWSGVDWILEIADLAAGYQYVFGLPTDRFRVLGIEIDAMLDPADPLAFVTGLMFDAAGAVSMSQTPIVEFVPAPGPLTLLGVGVIVLWRMRLGTDW